MKRDEAHDETWRAQVLEGVAQRSKPTRSCLTWQAYGLDAWGVARRAAQASAAEPNHEEDVADVIRGILNGIQAYYDDWLNQYGIKQSSLDRAHGELLALWRLTKR